VRHGKPDVLQQIIGHGLHLHCGTKRHTAARRL
jgi:hypothetical protein